MKSPQISFILPVYNDAHILDKNLPILYNYLRSIKIDYEIIVVDDGSIDSHQSQVVAERHHCRFLQNGRNLGKGAAIRQGMLQARGEFCFYTDGDIPFQVEALERFIYYLDFKEFDIVTGDRTLPGAEYYGNVSSLRKMSSRFFSFLVGRFVAGGFFDTQCGLKGFRATIARDLFSRARINGFAFDIEILYLALKRNYDIKRLPVRIRCNEGCSVKVLRHGPGMFLDIFRVKFFHLTGAYAAGS